MKIGTSHIYHYRHFLITNCLLSVLCLCLLLTTGHTAADTNSVTAPTDSSYSITMTPSSTELQAPPGGSITGKFTVINEGSTGYNTSLSVAPYYVVGDNYLPKFTLLPGKTDASSWIHLNNSATQYLPAKLPQTVSYSLNVPKATAPGGYYAVIFAETEPATASSGITAHNRVGDIVYITVEGPVVKRGSIVASHLTHLVLSNSLAVGLLVKDSGGLHFLTNVQLSVKNSINKNIAFSASLQRYVLPQTERLVTSTWSSLPVFGIYKVDRSATVFGNDQSLPAQTIIIIRPWLLILLVVIIVGAVLLIVRHIIKPANKVWKGKH